MRQTDFRDALLNPDAPVPRGLTDPQGRPAGRRFDVYRNNVAASLTRALEAGFPVLRKILGQEFFAAMAGIYLREHPPQSRLIMLYGDRMPEFLTGFPPVAHLPYLPDVARLETAMRESYHAADAPVLTAEQLSPEQMLTARLRLAPSLRLIRSDWPIHTIWTMNTSGRPAALPDAGEAVLVLRREYDPEPHLISHAAAEFVDALLSGSLVGIALEQAGDDLNPEAILSLLLRNGAITGVIR